MTSDNPDEMLSAWTPGPWMASDARYPNRPIVRMARVNGAHGVFTKIADINAGLNEANANARLIAAAPDLAEALRKIMNAHASNVMFHDRALAERAWTALSKARGA